MSKLAKLLDPEIRAKNVEHLRLKARELAWRVLRPAMPDPIFVIGCSRSGTTVTFETLAAAPELRSLGFEVPQLWNRLWGPAHNGWESEAAAATDARPGHRDAALAYFYARLGAGQVLDKTCINTLRVPFLDALFPRARYVFIYRDGRDNVSSLIDGWRHDGHFRLSQFLGPSPEPVAINDGEFREWSFFLPPGWRAYNRARLEDVCAYQWITANRMALDAGRGIAPERWIAMRYEDLFDRPVALFREVFDRLGLRFTGEIEARCAGLGARPTSIVKGPPAKAKWRKSNPEAIERVLPTLRPMLLELGYDADG